MSIANEIIRLQEAKQSIRLALQRQGYSISSSMTLDEYAVVIDPITSGETIEYLDNPQGYLSFKFVTDGTVKWQNKKGDIEYSKNGGATWTAFNGTTVSASTGDEIWFKGSLTGGCGASQESGSSKFYTTGYFYSSGNIQSLCSFNNTLQVNHFSYLFRKCIGMNIESNRQLSLPATTLATACYSYMFQGCISLITAPSLPATTLEQSCYTNMFSGCTSLTTAPELSATTLANYCYNDMFNGCTSLNYIKAMFTTTPGTSYMNSWVNGVASSGTFVKNAAATWTSSCGISTYPCNWTVQTASS